jgi:hypothetical protein
MVLGVALVAGNATAATVTVNTDNSNLLVTTGLTGFATSGDEMTGMVVTADFSNGASETLNWAVTGAGSGGVTGGLFSLNMSGDTFTAPWTLVNTNAAPGAVLTNLTINAGAGDTVFDIVNGPFGTDGSADGRAFEEFSAPIPGDITALYSNPVALSGDPFVGDLYALLSVDFTELLDAGLLVGLQFDFRADTDNLFISGDLRPIPLPAALPLMLTGLGVLGFLARRRRAMAA